MAIPPKGTLDSLALKYGTDKSSKWHNFANLYEEILMPKYESIKGIIELGVNTGKSLNMWADYFPHANIVGVDRRVYPDLKLSDKIKIVQGEQDSQSTLLKAVKLLNNEVQLIIDDASHINKLSITSFEYLFYYLAPGGIYIIEDTTTVGILKNYGNEFNDMEFFVNSLFRNLNFNGRRLFSKEIADFSKLNQDLTMNYFERWLERIVLVYGAFMFYKRSH